jgi:hypothetical protein
MRTVLLPRARAVRAVRGVSVAVLCVLASPCFAAPKRPAAGPDPSDPNVRVPSATYRPVVSGYRSQRPVEPLPWRERNEQVAPTPKR